jgi:Transposase
LLAHPSCRGFCLPIGYYEGYPLVALKILAESSGKPLIIACLFRELVEQGYKGSYASVRDNLVRLLLTPGRKNEASPLSKAPALAPSRQAAFLFLRRPEKLRVEEQETVAKLRQINPEVDRAHDLVQQFAQMLRTRTGEHLDGWLDQVERSELPELQSFAAGVKKDKDAVRAGLTWWISNGMVEGHVTKLNLIKRQGYGRAGFPLLRKRVLHALEETTSPFPDQDEQSAQGPSAVLCVRQQDPWGPFWEALGAEAAYFLSDRTAWTHRSARCVIFASLLKPTDSDISGHFGRNAVFGVCPW